MSDADSAASGPETTEDAVPEVSRPDRPHGVLLTLAYDGKNFAGFVKQHRVRTVAGELAKAIATVDPDASKTRVVSRTDAGVHARGQRVSFATMRDISSRGWVLALGQGLPDDISIVRAVRVPPSYDPRHHAEWKRYRYLIHHSPVSDPFLAGRAWRLYYKLDLELMRREAESLVGRHDFAAFRGAADVRTTTERTLSAVTVESVEGGLGGPCIAITVTGDRFLYNMVRIIVGTLVDVGRGQLPPGTVRAGLDSLKRESLGMTAPPDGLCLEHVELGEVGTGAWPA